MRIRSSIYNEAQNGGNYTTFPNCYVLAAFRKKHTRTNAPYTSSH